MQSRCNLIFLFLFLLLAACSKSPEDKYNEKWVINEARKQVFNVKNTSKGIPIEDVREMICGKDGLIWFRGENDDICSWKDDKWNIYDFQCKKLRSSYGNIIFLTYDNIKTLRNGRIENIDFKYKKWGGIADVAVSREGKIWTLFTSGILMFDGKTFNPIPFSERFLSQDLFIAVSEDNKIFIGNYMGLFRMVGEKLVRIVVPEMFENASINSLFTSSKGIVWGSGRQKNQYFVFSYNNGEFKFWEKERKAEGFIEDFEGTIYISDFIYIYYPPFLGFEYFDCNNWQKINLYDLDSLFVSKINLDIMRLYYRNEVFVRDRNGDYWLLAGEVSRYSDNAKKFEFVRPEGGLLSDKINDIRYLNGKWFIATQKGLSIYDGENWQSFFLGEIYDITSTEKGLVYALGQYKIFIISNKNVDTLDFPLQTKSWSKLAMNNEDFLLSKDTVLLVRFNDYWIRYKSLNGKVVDLSRTDKGFWVVDEDNVFNLNNNGMSKIKTDSKYLPGKISCFNSLKRDGFLLGASTGIYLCKEGKMEGLFGKDVGDILNLRKGVFNDIWLISEKNPHLKRLEFLEKNIYPVDYKINKNAVFDISDNGDILLGKDGLVFFDFDYEYVKKEKVAQERKSWQNPLKPFFSGIKRKILSKFKECDLEPPLNIKVSKNLNRRLLTPPAVSGDNLFFLDEDGYLIKFDFSQDEFLWKIPLKDEKSFRKIKLYNNNIYLLGSNVLIIDANSGNILRELPFYAEDMVINDDILLLLCKNLIRGIRLTQNRWEEVSQINLNTIDNKMLSGSESMLYVFSKNFQKAFSKENELIWENRRLYDSKASPVAFEDIVISPKLDTLIATDNRMGNIRWKFKTGSDIVSNIEITGSRILLGDSSGCVSCLVEGEEKWKVVLPENTYPENTLESKNFKFYLRASKNFLYVVMDLGKIFAYDLKNGELSWGYYEIYNLRFPPILECDKLIIITEKGVLYVLGN